MRLFLASSLDKTIDLLVQKSPTPLAGQKVLFIANAADNAEGDKWWIKTDREAFDRVGCSVIDIDLRKISVDEFNKEIEGANIIHFCGGSVLYLISLIKKQGLDKIITDAVSTGKIIYSGTSAGSMIVSKELSLCKYDDDEQKYMEGLIDFSGLGLVNFLILPHANSKDFVEANLHMVEKLPEYNQPLIILYDNQAVWVDEGKIEILTI